MKCVRKPPAREPDDEQISDRELDVIFRVAQERAELVKEMRAALKANDMDRLITAARELCGMVTP